jgi:hypothetical protein
MERRCCRNEDVGATELHSGHPAKGEGTMQLLSDDRTHTDFPTGFNADIGCHPAPVDTAGPVAEDAGWPADHAPLHICVGCSPERLAAIPAGARRQQALAQIHAVAARLPTVFVIGERHGLCEELRDVPGTVLRSATSSALSAAGIEAFLNRSSTIVLTGLETSFEIYATAAELVYCTHWHILLPQDAILDRHTSSHGGCLRLLAQGYAGYLSVLSLADLWQALGTAIRTQA